MPYFNLPTPLLRLLTIPACCLALFSCQSTRSETQIQELATVQDSLLLMEETMEKPWHQVAIPASFTEDTAKELESQLDSIFQYYHRRRGFNGTVMVTKYDKVVFKGAYGYSDLARKEPLDTETAFQLASVSKQFTAMAIMILQERGIVSYEDLVQEYIPDFPYEGITIRQLLTHRSGLSNYTYFSDDLWPDRQVPITNDDVIGLMKSHQPQVYYQPNVRFDYSNTGYFLLASIVEKATGEPFASFLHHNIFEPLEMHNTFTHSDSLPYGKVATGHTRNRRKRMPDYLDTVLGDKGMYSTVEDLYKWDQALYTEKLVKKETLEEAFSNSQNLKRKYNEDYGFGWRLRDLKNGERVVYHAGLWHGYNTYLLRNPNDHSAIIILSNLSNGSLKFVQDLQDFLYPEMPPHQLAGSEEQPDHNGDGKERNEG
jgi:CubicO group peptidase (beta-lactamase class C family)